MEPGLGGGLSS